jgi:hypothetical protein
MKAEAESTSPATQIALNRWTVQDDILLISGVTHVSYYI